MTTLLRLYPRPWRERYGDELLALLADRPTTFIDRLDLIRGAVDARLHPELVEPAAHPRGTLMDSRLPGIAAIAAGTLWLVDVAIGAIIGTMEGSLIEAIAPILLYVVVALMLLAAIGPFLVPYARRVWAVLAAIALAWLFAIGVQWPLSVYLVFVVLGVIAACLLWLASYRAGLGNTVGLLIIVVGVVLPLGLLFADFAGPFTQTGTRDWAALLLAPFGVAWLLVGAIMLRRFAGAGAARRREQLG